MTVGIGVIVIGTTVAVMVVEEATINVVVVLAIIMLDVAIMLACDELAELVEVVVAVCA